MKITKLMAVIALSSVMAPAAFAQEATEFPAACKSEMAASMPMGDAGGMAKHDHQKAQMEGMQRMHDEMMQGMMKEDADVAFICGMIAHHRGALAMANVELKFGDNEEARGMAQKVIEAQTKEIADMTRWLQANAK